jgi:hypothetical protein
VINKDELEAISKDFVLETKARLKDHWNGYSEQTKLDIEATAIFAAKLSAKIAIAGKEAYAADLRHLEAQMASIQVLGTLEFQSIVVETIDAAAKIAGTVLNRVLIKALTGGIV